MNMGERSERVASETFATANVCRTSYQSSVYIESLCKVRNAALPCAKAVPGLRILREDACLMPSSDEQQEVLCIKDASIRDHYD